MEIRIGEARGHCHEIANIYTLYLDPRFHNILSPDEAEAIGDLFNQLSISDVGMVASLNAVGQWLTSLASKTLDLVDAEKYDEANAEIKAARRDVLPIRLAITKALNDLRQLQAEFIRVSGIA